MTLAPDRLVGSWAFVEYVLTDAEGRVSRPWEAGVPGLLIYTSDGYMSATIARPGAAGGYCGRYEVEGDHVVHTVIASGAEELIGTKQRRAASLDGDTLTLTSSPTLSFGPGSSAKIVWRRLAPKSP